jgi:predicted small metal-binding protein
MAVTIRCADFNTDCPAQFTTPEEEELVQHVKLHTRAAHQRMEWTPELVEVVKTQLKNA